MAAKKKKSFLKRVLKILGITVLVILIAIITIPIFFKDEIKNLALKEANKMLKADVAVGDFSLTMLSSFPKMRLEFQDVSVTGRDQFEGVKLIDAKAIQAKLDFWSVITLEDLTVRSVRLIEPKINVVVLETGEANYDIVKSDGDTVEVETEEVASPFEFSLDYYEIEDGDIIYDDRQSPMYADIQNLNHTGSFDYKTSEVGDLIGLETATTMDELTYKMNGLSYLSKAKLNLELNLLMELKDDLMKFTLQENQLSLNALHLSFEGFYEMLENKSNIDFKLASGNTTFKQLLSLIPAFYKTGYEDMIADGSMKLNAFVKGTLSDSSYPAWDVNLNVENASIAYPDMPATIDNVIVDASSTFKGGADLDAMTVSVNQLKATFIGNSIDANFFMKNPMSDPFMKAKLFADVNLASLEKVYPMEDKYTGKLTSDISFEGRLSTLENEEYNKVNAQGNLKLQGFNYSSQSLPAPVIINDLIFEFSPQQLKLATLQATMGKSDFSMNGNISNYMGYLFKENEELQGVFNYHSSVLNVDALMPQEAEQPSETAQQEQADTSASSGPILVPDNINFVLNTTIDNAKYDGMDFKNVKGKIILRNEQLILDGLSMNALGGKVALSGKYDTQNAQEPVMDFKYDLQSLSIEQLTTNFLTIEKLAPIAKYVKGNISSSFSMTSLLKPSLEPIFNSINGEGSLFTGTVSIQGFEPLNKLGSALNIEKMKEQTINNVRAYFEIEDGKLNVKPFDVKLAGISTTVQGSTSLSQAIDYQLKMNIPKEMVPSKIVDLAEKAVSNVKNIPGFKMDGLPEEIPVTAFITNTITDPKVKTNLKEKLMELGGGVKEQVKELVDEKVQEVKDTVKEVIDKTVDKASAELEAKKKQILAEAQKQADRLVAEGKKQADNIRSEANKQADKLIKDAGSNIFKKKAAEVAAKKIRDEGEQAAQKVEREAQNQANKIMAEAQKRADKLTIK